MKKKLPGSEFDITIDDEFAGLLPAQSDEEVAQLRKNIIDCGLLSPLVVWSEVNEGEPDRFTLVDGHTRLKICEEEKISFEVVELSFNDRAEALEWIYENQRGRRNWSAERESYVRGKVYNEKKRSRGSRTTPGAPTTSEAIASESGVSSRTVQRDGDFAKAVDRIAEKAPELKAALLDGKSKASKKEVQKLANAPESEVKAAAAKILSGEPKKAPPQTVEVMFAKLESAAGLIARLTDDINSKNPGSMFFARAIQTSCDDILNSAKEWQEKLGDSGNDYDFASAVPGMEDGEFV